MGFISQNDAYLFWGGFFPSFLWLSAVLFLVFRGSVLWLSDSFLFDFFFSSWFCLVVLILCVLLRQEIAFGVQRRVAYSEVLLLSLFLFYVFHIVLRIGNAVQHEISPIVFSDNYIGFYVTYSCLEDMRLNNSFNSFVALCYTNIRWICHNFIYIQ